VHKAKSEKTVQQSYTSDPQPQPMQQPQYIMPPMPGPMVQTTNTGQDWISTIIAAAVQQMFQQQSGKLERLLLEKAIDSMIKDMELASKVKAIMLETPAQYIGKGIGRLLEQRITGSVEEEDIEDRLARAIVKALRMASRSGEGELRFE